MTTTTTNSTNFWLAFVAGIAAIATMGFNPVEAFGTSVVYGPAAREMILLTSKIAAKEGQDSFCIVGPGQESKSRRLMYGAPDEKKKGQEGNDEPSSDAERSDDSGPKYSAQPISSGEDIGNALTKATTLFLVCYDQPIEEKALNTLLNTAGTDLSKVVMLSKMGATAGGGGGFFGGGSKLLDSENIARKLCKAKDLDLSIVRAGQLKGGGPGEPFDLDYGLSKTYYYTLFELSEASCTMSHDRFTLGIDCSRGDSVDLPNPLTLFGTKTSFDPYPYDTNRINAAMACVMAAKHDKPVEFSVASAKAPEPPSKEEWAETMAKMEV